VTSGRELDWLVTESPVRLITRLPIYAAGLGLTVALAAVADARDWSGRLTLAAALGVGGFYVVTILVPSLIREQTLVGAGRARGPSPDANGGPHVFLVEVSESNGAWVPQRDGNGGVREPATYGPVVISPEPPLTARS
jgi:hypothetical protein